MTPQEYFFKEGCFIEEWLNSSNDPAMSIARVRVEAGETTKLHLLLDTTERYVILSGSAEVEVSGRSWHISEKDVVTIAASQPQRIRSDGNEDLIFLAICTPRFEQKNYQEV